MASLTRVRQALFFTLFALPILFFPWAFMSFELPKVFLLYLFAVFAVYFLSSSGYRLIKFTKIQWLYIIFLIWIIITAISGLSFNQSILGSYFRMQGLLTWICYGILFFISGKLLEDSHSKKYACSALLISSTFTAIFAILQFVLLWFFKDTSQLLYSNRVIATFGQPNFLGAFLVMSLPFAWFNLKQVRRGWKAVILFLMIVIVLGIFSTLSRSAYLGLAVLALVWGFYHYRMFLTGIILSVALFAILANLLPNLVYSQWYKFQVDTVSKWTAENRLVIAQKSIELIAQKPITGYGLENYFYAFPSVVKPKDIGLQDIVVDSSHNLFLDLAVQTGLIGLALFLAILILTIIRGLKKDNFAKAALCSVIAFITIHQFSVLSVVPLMLFWLSLGIINGSPLKHVSLTKTSGFIINLIGIYILCITLLFTVQTFRAEAFFRQAGAYEVANIHKAINLDNEAIMLAPWIEFYTTRRNFLLMQLGYPTPN